MIAVTLLMAATCAAPAAGGRSPSEAGRREPGREVYNLRCYFCHGYSGDAKTLAASLLVPPPRDFTSTSPTDLGREAMRTAVRQGRPGTAMQGFGGILSAREIDAVVDFVRQAFMTERAVNTRYHTRENGWPDHGRFRAAFPFATGELPLDRPASTLSPEQAAGRWLFLTSCVSCHDRARVLDEGPIWAPRAVSYPRNPTVADGPVDAFSGATPFHLHERPPATLGLSARARAGERLFQANCAFCHGADGTGRNWIGAFLEPRPRDLTALPATTLARLEAIIRDGVPATSMPAWSGVLNGEAIASIAAYVRAVIRRPSSGSPATREGPGALASSSPVLSWSRRRSPAGAQD